MSVDFLAPATLHSRFALRRIILLSCLALAVGGYVLIKWQQSASIPSSAIPLPFGQEQSSLQGQLLSLGTVGGRHVVDMTFEDGKVSEAFGVNDLTFLVTPSDPTTFSAGAPLSSAFAPGTRFYGYKYKSADASREIEMQRLKNNPPLDADGKPTAYTYSQLFPGTFFASDLHRNDTASFASTFHGSHDDVIFKPVSEVMLEPSSRYLIIAEANPTNPEALPVSISVRSLTWCGDGIVQSGEQCDDGNQSNTDSCTNVCKNPVCGDGFVQLGEQCDDGNRVNNDQCSTACVSAWCGDGIVQIGEYCDDRNQFDNDGCSNACQKPACSDGLDNDGDTLIDALDPGCTRWVSVAMAYDPKLNNERNICDYGLSGSNACYCAINTDCEGDQFVDYGTREECAVETYNDVSRKVCKPVPQCRDARDNNGNGKKNFCEPDGSNAATCDLGCRTPDDPSEDYDACTTDSDCPGNTNGVHTESCENSIVSRAGCIPMKLFQNNNPGKSVYDVLNDGVVDIRDINYFMADRALSPGNFNRHAKYPNVNGDGYVDQTDLDLLRTAVWESLDCTAQSPVTVWLPMEAPTFTNLRLKYQNYCNAEAAAVTCNPANWCVSVGNSVAVGVFTPDPFWQNNVMSGDCDITPPICTRSATPPVLLMGN